MPTSIKKESLGRYTEKYCNLIIINITLIIYKI